MDEEARDFVISAALGYFKITFTAGNFTPDSEVKPCTGIEGMKAFVDYAEVTDKAVAGQIVSIELSK